MKKLKRAALLCCFTVLFAVPSAAVEEDEAAEAQQKIWKTRLELSYIVTRGNTENETFANKVTTEGNFGENRLFADSLIFIQNTNGLETANQIGASGRYERTISDRFFLLGQVSYLRDQFSGYDYRISAGPGLGYDVISGERATLKIYTSLLYYWDEFSDPGLEQNSYLGISGSADGEVQVQDNLTLTNRFDVNLSTEDGKNYFIDNESAAKVAINSNLALAVSYLVKYRNNPPTEAIDRYDTTFLTSLVITF